MDFFLNYFFLNFVCEINWKGICNYKNLTNKGLWKESV